MNALRPVAGLYLRFFLMMRIGYVLLSFIIIFILLKLLSTGSFTTSIMTGISVGIIGGATYGILTSILVIIHILGIKLKGYPLTNETIGWSHLREFTLHNRYDEAYNNALSSLESITKSRIVQDDRETGKIEAIIHGLWRGKTKISLEIYKQPDDATRVKIVSAPWTKSSNDEGISFDGGRCLFLADKVANLIKRNSTN